MYSIREKSSKAEAQHTEELMRQLEKLKPFRYMYFGPPLRIRDALFTTGTLVEIPACGNAVRIIGGCTIILDDEEYEILQVRLHHPKGNDYGRY